MAYGPQIELTAIGSQRQLELLLNTSHRPKGNKLIKWACSGKQTRNIPLGLARRPRAPEQQENKAQVTDIPLGIRAGSPSQRANKETASVQAICKEARAKQSDPHSASRPGRKQMARAGRRRPGLPLLSSLDRHVSAYLILAAVFFWLSTAIYYSLPGFVYCACTLPKL